MYKICSKLAEKMMSPLLILQKLISARISNQISFIFIIMNPIMPFSRQSSYSKGTFIFAVNSLMPVDNKKAHTYLDKPAAER